MANPPKPTLAQVLESFQLLTRDEQARFLHEILDQPFRNARDRQSATTLFGFAHALLGVQALDAALKELRATDSEMEEAHQQMRANLERMLKTTDAALALATRLNEELARRTPQVRNIDRDNEIVRLHDEEDKSFGEIGRLLRLKNPSWCGKNNKQLTSKAVQKAYHRRKAMET